MKILFLHGDRRGPGEGGGAETLLADTMAILQTMGHETAWWHGQISLAKMVQQFRPDVCHVVTVHVRFGLEPVKQLQRWKIPHIWHLQDYWPFCGGRMLLTELDRSCAAVEGICNGLCTGHRAPESFRAVVNASPLIVSNRYTADIFRRNGIEIAAVVALGIDTGLFQPGPAKRDGVEVVTVTAWPRFPTKGMHIFQAALRKLKVGAKLVTGVSRERVRDELQKASIFVFPSCYQETWGLCLTEAMACGCACISSDVAGPRAQLVHGRTGVLVPPCDVERLAEAIRWLLDHPGEREAMGRCARTWAERKAPLEAMGKRWIVAYERILTA